jgi:hypothetical protein
VGVVSKGRNRFIVSDSQWALFALRYGDGEPLEGWEYFEHAAALFLRMTMVGLRGATISDALGVLAGNPDPQLKSPCWRLIAPARSPAKLSDKLSYLDVLSWSEVQPINRALLEGRSADDPAWLRLKAAVDAGVGALIVNAADADFAGVMFVSKELVILVHTKFITTAKQPSATTIAAEMTNCGVAQRDGWLLPVLDELCGRTPCIVCGFLTTGKPINLHSAPSLSKLQPRQPLCIVQWRLDREGVVATSKVRTRFPRVSEGTTLGTTVRAELGLPTLLSDDTREGLNRCFALMPLEPRHSGAARSRKRGRD